MKSSLWIPAQRMRRGRLPGAIRRMCTTFSGRMTFPPHVTNRLRMQPVIFSCGWMLTTWWRTRRLWCVSSGTCWMALTWRWLPIMWPLTRRGILPLLIIGSEFCAREWAFAGREPCMRPLLRGGESAMRILWCGTKGCARASRGATCASMKSCGRKDTRSIRVSAFIMVVSWRRPAAWRRRRASWTA